MKAEIEFRDFFGIFRDFSWTAYGILSDLPRLLGYGHIYPKTYNGRLFYIVFSIIGIALMMTLLKSCGAILAAANKKVYSNAVRRLCRKNRWVKSIFSVPILVSFYDPSRWRRLRFCYICLITSIFYQIIANLHHVGVNSSIPRFTVRVIASLITISSFTFKLSRQPREGQHQNKTSEG